MDDVLVDVLQSGAVCLGAEVVCDGFVDGYGTRVQTHTHADHMADFERSKGLQDFVLSPECFELLVAEYNAELEVRDNFLQLPRGASHSLPDGSRLRLIPSDHMLGASQVSLELTSGRRVGYSGDFGWPLDEVMRVDELVVDSTYGSPDSVRHYTQSEAEQSLIELVCTRLRHGSVHLNAFRGTVERVLQVLAGKVDVPILGSRRLLREVDVYRRHGFAAEGIVATDSPEGRAAQRERAYVRLYSAGDGFRNEQIEGTSITVSAYMADRRHPLTVYSERAYKVAMSNHADFNGTLDYVEATGAARVVTDNTRNNGVALALAIKSRLGIDARPSSNLPGPRWR